MPENMTSEEYDMYEKLFNTKGARIRFDCDKVTYQGIVGEFNTVSCQFELLHAIIVGTDDYMGKLRFRYHEIKSFIVVEPKEDVERYGRNECLINILRNRPVEKCNIAKFVCNLSDDSDDESSIHDDDEPMEKFVLDVPYYLKSKLPNESIVLDSVDSDFKQAIYDIFQEKAVGVSFEGALVSRFGKISFISIATRTHVYLFDIESLSEDAFQNGLRDILEDPHLLKVVHDSKFSADCLTHVYNTEFENIFDTQVADFVVAKHVYNDKYKYDSVCSLDGALAIHLDLPPEYIHRRVKGLSDSERNGLFTKRPLSNEFRYDLSKNAIYLLLLHKTLSKKLRYPLHRYSVAFRNLISREGTPLVDFLGSDLSSPECMPSTLFMNGIQTAKFVRPKKKELPSLQVKYIHPKTGKLIVIKDDVDASIETSVPAKDVKKHCDKSSKNRAVKRSMSPSTVELCFPSDDLENSIVGCFGPSRPMDEIFHKLANNQNSRSINKYTVNVTPDYVSKITMRMPFTDYKNNSKVSEPESLVSEETWAKLRAECDVPRAPLPNQGKKKIRFVAG